jgi:hypothetical protein
MGRLLITEEEKDRIKKLYGIVLEYNEPGSELYTIDFQELFDGGKWKISQKEEKILRQKLSDAQSWIAEKQKSIGSGMKTQDGKVLMVRITASESQVTNTDQEPGPTFNTVLDQYQLSRNRATSLQNFLNNIFNNWVSQKLIAYKPIFQVPDILLGNESYETSLNFKERNTEKYKKDQFVKVEILLAPPQKCLEGLSLSFDYYKTKNSAYPCRGGHSCNDAIFNLKINNTIIGQVNLNNGGTGNDVIGKNKFTVTPEQASAILKGNPGDLKVYLVCTQSGRCHSSTPEVTISRNNAIVKQFCSPSISEFNDYSTKLLFRLDVCGNIIEEGKKENSGKMDRNMYKAPIDLKTGYAFYNHVKKTVEVYDNPPDDYEDLSPLFGLTPWIGFNVTQNKPATFYKQNCKSPDKAIYGGYCIWSGYKTTYKNNKYCDGITQIEKFDLGLTLGDVVSLNTKNLGPTGTKPCPVDVKQTNNCNPPQLPKTTVTSDKLPSPYNMCPNDWDGKDLTKCGTFNPNGENIVRRSINGEQWLSQVGTFKDGKLFTGSLYCYEDKDYVVFINKYKNGRYVGEGTF